MQRFGENLRQLRRDMRGMGQAELAQRVSDLGVPLRVNSISRLENGTRVADVPELLALAVALDVTPNRLLLTADATDEPVGLTPNLSVTARCAWKWAAGDQALPKNGVDRYGSGFQLVNRPHNPPDRTTVRELDEHSEALSALYAEVQRAVDNGVPARVVFAAVRSLELPLSMWNAGLTFVDSDVDETGQQP